MAQFSVGANILAWLALNRKYAFERVKLNIDGWLVRLAYRGKMEADGRTLSSVISILGFLLLAYGFWKITEAVSFPGFWAGVPVSGALLIIMAGPGGWINRHILSSRVAVWFGLISFPLYLWHWPLLSFTRIIENKAPSHIACLACVVVAILLAWLTVRFVEKPFRFNKHRAGFKVAVLCGLMVAIGVSGYFMGKRNFAKSHGYEKLVIKRRGFERAFGSSLSWYIGKNDWMYLGKAYDNTVAKLKMEITPTDAELTATREDFSRIAKAGAEYGARVVLFVGPDKSSVYPEYLPDGLTPSPVRYSSFFLKRLEGVPNLVVYDPTDYLISKKSSEGLLYWMTDTHWNNKGAFLAYSGFSRLLDLPVPKVGFKKGLPHRGDLLDLSRLNDFPLHAEDSWDAVWESDPVWIEKEIKNEKNTSFGSVSVVTNERPLSNKYVWVVGDSYVTALRQYFNATFREVRYVGHWNSKLNELPADIAGADRKPDMVVIIKVERSF